MNILNLRAKDKIQYLKFYDILIITLIMFGYFIINSISQFLSAADANTPQIPEFTSSANWYALIFQLILLIFALIYLYFRNFDFSTWKIKISPKSILAAIALFIGVSILFDLYFTAIYSIIPSPDSLDDSIFYEQEVTNMFLNKLYSIDLSLLLYSALNGFYEELFFLGICLSVNPDKRKYYFIYSLIIRYSFHTYQGNISAFAIAVLVGCIYYLLYTRMKEKNLFPFFLAHAITDVFGAGIISYFL